MALEEEVKALGGACEGMDGGTGDQFEGLRLAGHALSVRVQSMCVWSRAPRPSRGCTSGEALDCGALSGYRQGCLGVPNPARHMSGSENRIPMWYHRGRPVLPHP